MDTGNLKVWTWHLFSGCSLVFVRLPGQSLGLLINIFPEWPTRKKWQHICWLISIYDASQGVFYSKVEVLDVTGDNMILQRREISDRPFILCIENTLFCKDTVWQCLLFRNNLSGDIFDTKWEKRYAGMCNHRVELPHGSKLLLHAQVQTLEVGYIVSRNRTSISRYRRARLRRSVK